MWIESHTELEHHPKTLHFQSLAKLSIDEALGKLHRLWYWASKYAEDGDLSKYGLTRINLAIGLKDDETALIEAGWLDTRPYLRVHDWWEYCGRYFKTKYRHNAGRLIEIERKCTLKPNTRKRHVNDTSKDTSRTRTVRDHGHVNDAPSYLPNMTSRTNTGPKGPENEEAAAAPTPRPKGATARPREKREHIKNCTCSECFAEVAKSHV